MPRRAVRPPVRSPTRPGPFGPAAAVAGLCAALAAPVHGQGDASAPAEGTASRDAPAAPTAPATVVVPATPTASVASDLLRVLDADGRSHVLQHTLAAEGATLSLALPGSVIPGRVLFTGPDRARWAARHERRPERVSIGSGGALVRYRHQYVDEVVEGTDGALLLVERSVPEALELETGADGEVPAFEAVSTWVFPAGTEVLAWRVQDASGGDGSDGNGAGGTANNAAGGPGGWSFEDDVLTWSQRGLAAVTLEIEYRPPGAIPSGSGATPGPGAEAETGTGTGPAPSSGTGRDADLDGVPDARDVCLDEPVVERADEPTNDSMDDPIDARAARARDGAAGLGCPGATPLVLRSIGFPTGRTRLDLPARRALDRLAAALGTGDGVWEIAAHTDSVGPASRNLALSLRRAESVRHYLMLRGVAPNRLVARGYGEAEPIADDASAEGRAANRRVELRAVDPGAAPARDGVGEDPPDGG